MKIKKDFLKKLMLYNYANSDKICHAHPNK